MKGNNGTGNIEERDTWETPQWLFNLINKQYNFDFECYDCWEKDIADPHKAEEVNE
jgi:hypothetical protein